MSTFKLIIVGDCGVGKTTFLQRHLTGEFHHTSTPTVGAAVTSLSVETTRGPVTFDCWDVSGACGEFTQAYCIQAHCAIIMFDVTSQDSYENFGAWYTYVHRVCYDIPIVLVGNKVDSAARVVLPSMILFHRSKGLQYYNTSALSGEGIHNPFLWLLRKLIGDATLQLLPKEFHVPRLPAAAPPPPTPTPLPSSEHHAPACVPTAQPKDSISDEIRVVIVGDLGVGKTKFLRRCLGSEYDMKPDGYLTTLTNHVYPLTVHTNRGRICFSCRDTARQESFGGLRDDYYSQAHCAMVMFNIASRASSRSLSSWYRDITRARPDIPIVVVGNNAHCFDHQTDPASLAFCERHGVPHFEISWITDEGLMAPFLNLARTIVGDPHLQFLIDDVPQKSSAPEPIANSVTTVVAPQTAATNPTAATFLQDIAAASAEPPAAAFKLILVGDAGVGKTAFLMRHLTGEFERRYIANVGVDVRPMAFHTSRGKICFNCWDVAGQDRLAGLRDFYYMEGNCAIIMVDATAQAPAAARVKQWHRDISHVRSTIPIVVVTNKVDCAVSDCGAVDDDAAKQVNGLQHYDVSVKSSYNLEKPFLWLARSLLNDADLQFVDEPLRERGEKLTPQRITELDRRTHFAGQVDISSLH